jgi:putative salt-induced outer membrane protein YdiY
MEQGTLYLDSDYAGSLKIPWKMVQRLESDEPMQVHFKGGGERRGAADSPKPGQMRLHNGRNATVALSQVKTINAAPDLKYGGRAQLGYDKSSGNTKKENLYASLEGSVRYQDHRVKGSGEYNLARNNGDETASNWRANLDYDHFLNGKLYANLNGQLEHDKFADLRLRKTLGPGLGYQFLDSDKASLSAEAGVNYVSENYYPNTSLPDRDYISGRWAVNFKWWVYKKYAQLYHRQYGLQSFKRSDNVLLQTRSGLRFPVTDDFFTSLQYNYDWRNVPPSDKKRCDQKYIITLGYELN